MDEWCPPDPECRAGVLVLLDVDRLTLLEDDEEVDDGALEKPIMDEKELIIPLTPP